MKKTIFRRFLLLFATFALGLGFATSVRNQKEIIKTSAAPITEGTALYLKPNANWLKDSARFAAYFFGGGDAWTDFVVVDEENKIYKTVSPEGNFTNFVISRMDPGTKENKWDNRWNQTNDLSFDGIKNLFTIDEGQWGDWVEEEYVGASYTESVLDASTLPTPAPLFDKNKTVYFRAKNLWHEDSENTIAAFFFNKLIYPAAGEFVEMTHLQNGVYKAEVPDEIYNYVLFALLKDVDEGWEEGNKVDQTGDLAHVEGEYLFLHDDYKWAEFDGNFVNFEPIVNGINKDRVRIWLNRNGHYEEEVYTLKIDGKYHLPTGYTLSLVTLDDDEAVTSSRDFAYFDLPKSLLKPNKEVDIAIVNSLNTKVITTFSAGEFEETDNSKLWTVEWDEGIEGLILEKKAIVLDSNQKIVNEFLGKMLEGYLTCLPSMENGYLAFDLINTNFLPGGKANMLPDNPSIIYGDLGSVAINDYEYFLGYDYDSDKRIVDITDAYSKYIMMEHMFINNPIVDEGSPVNITSIGNPNATFAIIFSVVLIAFGYIYFILPRKKRA